MITKREIVNIFFSLKKKKSFDNIIKDIIYKDKANINKDLNKKIISRFNYSFTMKWKKANRTKDIFMRYNKEWLDEEINVFKKCDSSENPVKRTSRTMPKKIKILIKKALILFQLLLNN